MRNEAKEDVNLCFFAQKCSIASAILRNPNCGWDCAVLVGGSGHCYA